MKIKIRKANKKDIPGLVELHKKSSDYHRKIDKIYASNTNSNRAYKDFLLNDITKRTLRIIIAEDDVKLIGFISAKIKRTDPYTAPPKVGIIIDGFVESRYQKMGIGHRMTKEMFLWFKKNKIKCVMLDADSRNKIGLHAWQKYGFKEFRKRMIINL
jgi:ribosomal protein S18 acetylase RimI-like enzyme